MTNNKTIKLKSYLSKGLITIGGLLCLNPYSLIAGLPIFLIGIILIILFYNDKKVRINWIAFPLVLIIFLYVIVMGTIYFFKL